jgi:hypothetical protein
MDESVGCPSVYYLRDRVIHGSGVQGGIIDQCRSRRMEENILVTLNCLFTMMLLVIHCSLFEDKGILGCIRGVANDQSNTALKLIIRSRQMLHLLSCLITVLGILEPQHEEPSCFSPPAPFSSPPPHHPAICHPRRTSSQLSTYPSCTIPTTPELKQLPISYLSPV